MALVNVHPDYLRSQHCWSLYEDLLKNMQAREGYWHALPRNVARWWQKRMQFQPQYQNGQWNLAALPGATTTHLQHNYQEDYSRYVSFS